MRSLSTAIATTLFLGFVGEAKAQVVPSLMLSCTGTLSDSLLNKVDKVRIGVLVNSQTMQVAGLGYGWEANIDKVNETLVAFHRYSGNDQRKTWVLVDGTIDH